MADLLIAKATTIVHYKGRRVKLRRRETIAEAGAEIVREHPDLWEPLTVEYPAAKQRAAKPVEQATAEPGEKRQVSPRVGKTRTSDQESGNASD